MNILTAVDMLNTARGVYLNDPSAVRFPDSKLFPALKVAQGMLETALEQNGVSCKKAISDPITVPTGTVILPSLPADFIWPIKLEERLSGSSDLYVPMTFKHWKPQDPQADSLRYWSWRGFLPQIDLLGATTERQVLLYYAPAFPPLNVNTDLIYPYAEEYYAAKVAEFAHDFQEQSPTLAEKCARIAEGHLNEIIAIMVKKGQASPVRRRPFRSVR